MPLIEGDLLHLYYDSEILSAQTPDARLVADEGDYSIWDKPCGMYSQGTKWGDHSSICRWIEMFGCEKYQLGERQAYLVHRLDRATSGLIVVAHKKKVTQKLARLFEDRKVEKRYQAIVHGHFPDSILRLEADIDGKVALTEILENHFDPTSNCSTLKINLATGRKHQIRKHLADANFPIVGDRLYGEKVDVGKDIVELNSNLRLRCLYLSFPCPVSGDLKCYSG